MKNCHGIVLFLSILVFSNMTYAQERCEPSESSCEYYLCLEQRMNCGYYGFPLRIGYRFCNMFLYNFRPYSLEVQDWLLKVRSCIQEKQENRIQLQCNQLAAYSAIDHTACYVESGFCKLSKIDRRTIEKYLLKNFLKAPKFFWMNIKQMLRKGCF